jgi:hypothetical protein
VAGPSDIIYDGQSLTSCYVSPMDKFEGRVGLVLYRGGALPLAGLTAESSVLWNQALL